MACGMFMQSSSHHGTSSIFVVSDKFRSCQADANVVWEGPYSGHYIASNDLITLTGITVEECKMACLQQKKFHCRSFDYYRPSDTCYLQTVNR